MKKATLTLLLCLSCQLVHAQEETSAYKETMQSLRKNFNNEAYKSIFALFSEEMKEYLPLPNTVSFFQGLRAQAGKMNETEFEGFSNQGTGSYKITFDNGIFILLLSLNEKGGIAGFQIKPYENPSQLSNNLFTQKAQITKEQTQIIFDHFNEFPNNTQAAIALINNGKISYFGLKRVENALISVENRLSVFEIGSITKVFTSTLLADFAVEKKLEVNEPINDYLDFELNENQTVNFLSLANHSSGLPRLPSNLNLLLANPKNPYSDYDKDELESYLAEKMEISNEQKGKYAYSNLGAGLLAYVLAEIEDTSFEELLQQRIFDKYDMLNSTTEKGEVDGEIVPGLDPEGNVTSNWEFASLKGAGAILSTIEDLANFGLAQFSINDKVLQMTQKSTLNMNENMDIGLGWHLLKNKNYLWHNGSTGGYSSSMLLDTTNKNGLIILSNVSAYHPKMTQIDALNYILMQGLK